MKVIFGWIIIIIFLTSCSHSIANPVYDTGHGPISIKDNIIKIGNSILDNENIGKPISKEIRINQGVVSSSTPQAWLYSTGGVEYWYYNWPGSITEAKARGKRLLTDEEWKGLLYSVTWSVIEKAKVLNIPFSGILNTWRYVTYSNEIGTTAVLWSSSVISEKGDDFIIPSSDDGFFYCFIQLNLNDINSLCGKREDVRSLRLILDKE
jgi:hypothetical protein